MRLLNLKNKTIKIILFIFFSLLLITALVVASFFMQIANAKNEVKAQIEKLPANYEKHASKDLLKEINEYQSLNNKDDIKKIAKDIELFIECKAFYRENDYPTIYIYTKDSMGNNLQKETGYVDSQIVFVENNGQVINDPAARIKVRGNSTAVAEKKPYNIKFSKKQNLFNFGESKKWSLLAECLDPTMIRNKVFLTLAKEMGMDYVSDSEYVKVYVDDKYSGVYLLVETPDVSPFRLDIDLTKNDIAFEYEIEKDDGESTYEYTGHGWRFVLNNPETPNETEMKNFLGTIYNFDDIVYSFDYEALSNFIDIDSFAKYYLLNEFAKNIDFDYSSVKFYKKNGIVYAGPVWDFDLSSGNYSIGYHYAAYKGETKEEKQELMNSYSDMWAQRNLIFDALTDYPQFNEKVQNYFDQYEDLFRSTYYDGGIIDQILNDYRDIIDTNYASVENDGAGWNISEDYSGLEKERFSTYDENVKYLKQWLENRVNYLKENNNWWY